MTRVNSGSKGLMYFDQKLKIRNKKLIKSLRNYNIYNFTVLFLSKFFDERSDNVKEDAISIRKYTIEDHVFQLQTDMKSCGIMICMVSLI